MRGNLTLRISLKVSSSSGFRQPDLTLRRQVQQLLLEIQQHGWIRNGRRDFHKFISYDWHVCNIKIVV